MSQREFRCLLWVRNRHLRAITDVRLPLKADSRQRDCDVCFEKSETPRTRLRNTVADREFKPLEGRSRKEIVEMAVRKSRLIPVALCAFILGIGCALGQGDEQDRAACRRDVKRFCQSELQRNPNDMLSITSCLQANRAKISRACRNALASYGR